MTLNARSGARGYTERTTPNVGPRPTLQKADGRAPRALADLLKEGLLAVTPELATRILRDCHYDRQRPVRPYHVSDLAMQMKNREWTQGTQIHFGKWNENFYLMNGQHRLHAVVESDTTTQFQLLVTDVESEVGLRRLYRRWDRSFAKRTITDTLTAEGIQIQYQLRKGVAEGAFQAALLIETRFTEIRQHFSAYELRSDEVRLRMLEPWWPVAAAYQDAIRTAPDSYPPIKRFLQTAGVMAVALITLRDHEAKADAFWRGIADNDGLRRDDPRAAYIRYLLSESIKSSFIAAKAASVAWNAWFNDEALQRVIVTRSPIQIDGCQMAVSPRV